MVVTYKLVNHEYFLDECQITEIPILTKYLEYSDVVSWNQTRNLMLCVLKPYLKKKDTTAQDILHLPIDDIDKEKGRTDVTKEEMDWWKQVKKQFKKES